MNDFHNFIVAPSVTIASHLEWQLRREFKFERKPIHITGVRDLMHMAGLDRGNVFVPVSSREFLSMQEWPQFVKRARLEWELRFIRGTQSMYSKWIEVYLP